MKYLRCLVLSTALFININASAMDDDNPLGANLKRSPSTEYLLGGEYEFIEIEGGQTNAQSTNSYDQISYSEVEEGEREPTYCITFECCCKPFVDCFLYPIHQLSKLLPSTYDLENLGKRFLCRRIDYKKENDDI